MLRKIGEFYLTAMALIVVITVYLAAQGQSQFEITLLALLAWPMSALVLVARNRVARILLDDPK